ncbi:MAG TPA: YwpF family protein [Pseudogracilibacillus sp.]|nr:YwpF family protein [Pseudogracilibacillus sp.]
MKTFKIKSLTIMAHEDDDIIKKEITLKDGLVINREDGHGWLIEAFIDKNYLEYFKSIQTTKELMVQVKITREENDPAFFITEITSLNEINQDNINVIFEGKIVDHVKSSIEEMLKAIIEEGYQGESLLKKFKELI